MTTTPIKRLLAAFAALASIAAFNAQAAGPTLSAGEFKVGLEATYPPFESWKDGKIVGFDPELAALLAKQLQAKETLADTKFTNLITGLEAGHYDAVISGLYLTPERLAKADGLPYAKTGALIIARKDGDIHPKTENELCGLKVGLQQGTSWVKDMQDLSAAYCKAQGKPGVTVQEYPTSSEAAAALLSRNVDAQLEIAGAAKLLAEKTKGRLIISSPDLVYPKILGLYVKKGNTALLDALKTAMAGIRADGSYDALLKQYELSPSE